MAFADEHYGFARADVANVARRQLCVSAAILAIVGFATLATTLALADAPPRAASATISAPAVPLTMGQLERVAHRYAPG